MDAAVTRVAVVASPDWPAQAAAIERGLADASLAVVSAQRIVARTSSAARDGVEVGMRIRQAQGLVPDLVIEPAAEQRDRIAFEPLVRAVCEIAPLVEVTRPGMVLIATRGPSRYFGGDQALAERLH